MADLLHIKPEIASMLSGTMRFVLKMNLPSPKKGVAGANDELAKKLTDLLIKHINRAGFIVTKKSADRAHSSNDTLTLDQSDRAKAWQREDNALPVLNDRTRSLPNDDQ